MKGRGRKLLSAVLGLLTVILGAGAGILACRLINLQKYDEQLSLGAKYLEELDYENAEICFQKAIEIDDKRVASYVQLSIVYVKQQRYAEAGEMLKKAAKYADPKGEEAVDWIDQQIEAVEEEEEKHGADRPEDEGEDGEALFTAYLRDTLVPATGLADLAPADGWMYSMSDTWYNPLGILSALIEDLDGDGGLEMLVLSVEEPSTEEELYPDGKDVLAQVYELEGGEVRLAASDVLQEYNPEHQDWKPHTFLLPQADQINFHVSLAEAEGRKYLFCERYELAAAFADGSIQDYWMMYYEDGELKMRASFTQPGMGSAEFQYVGYVLEDGQEASSELLYSEWYEEPGKYSTFDQAVKGFFGPLGVETAFVEKGPSILADSNQMMRILDYDTSVAERSADYRSAKFHLEAIDHTGLRERLGEEEEKEETTADSGAWKEEYLKRISEAEAEMPYVRYQLIYIDNDDIPELLMDYGNTAAGGELCICREGSVSSQRIYSHGLTYIERKNLFCESGGRLGTCFHKIYRINDDKEVELIAEGTAHKIWENGVSEDQYIWNGENVSQETYESSLRAVMDVDAARDPYENMLDRGQVIEKIRSLGEADPLAEEELTAAEAGEAVAAHYNETYPGEGKYVVFAEETTDTGNAFEVLVRYQPAEGESGTANRLTDIVTVTKDTKEASAGNGDTWKLGQ